MILVDTSIWSLALRRGAENLSGQESRLVLVLAELIRGQRAKLLGPNRQELLSGIRERSQFQRIRDYLRDFPNVNLDGQDYEEAARISNDCRRAGISSSPVDMLMCAAATRYGWSILTTDRDFTSYGKVAPIKLFHP